MSATRSRIGVVLRSLPFGRVAEVEAGELHARLVGGEPVQLLDVRTRAEWSRGHVEGAVNVPVTELAGRLAGLELDPGVPVVAICLSAHRSVPAVRWLRRAGHASAVQLAGGMRAWWARGLPTVTPGEVS